MSLATFKELRVATLCDARGLIQSGWASHAVSLLDPGTAAPAKALGGHLVLHFEDISPSKAAKRPDAHLPKKSDVGRILAFAHAIPEGARLVVHCHAGLGRSPAAAIAILIQSGMGAKEAVEAIGSTRPWMSPNRAVTDFAGEILDLGGKISEAVEVWCKTRDAGISPGSLLKA